MEVRSEFNGIVFKIEVAVGDRVEPDQTLIILESMKMELPIPAPGAGVVRQILAEEGATVEEDDLLLTLDPA